MFVGSFFHFKSNKYKRSKNWFMVFQHFRCRKICKIVCMVSKEVNKSKFVYQDDLEDRCLVVRFFCRNYYTIFLQTRELSDDPRKWKNWFRRLIVEWFLRWNRCIKACLIYRGYVLNSPMKHQWTWKSKYSFIRSQSAVKEKCLFCFSWITSPELTLPHRIIAETISR